MPKYLLSVYQPDGEPPETVDLPKIMSDVAALEERMRETGVWVFSGGLHGPESATVLRNDGSQVMTLDGPYIEGKEHLGGFTIIDVPDLDVALDWGRQTAEVIPGLAIEVRPFQW